MSLALAQVKGQAHTATSPPKSWKEKQEGEIDPGEAGRAEPEDHLGEDGLAPAPCLPQDRQVAFHLDQLMPCLGTRRAALVLFRLL